MIFEELFKRILGFCAALHSCFNMFHGAIVGVSAAGTSHTQILAQP